jgi:hypothetical protein
MRWYSRSIILFFLSLFLLMSWGESQASACLIARPPLDPVLSDVKIEKDGSLTARMQAEPGYTEYMFLIFQDEEGNEVKRVPITSMTRIKTEKVSVPYSMNPVEMKAGSISVPRKELGLPSGTYTVTLQVSNYDPDTRKETGTYTYDACWYHKLYSKAQTIVLGEAKKEFPGELAMKEDGTVQIVINLTEAYERARFYLVVSDEEDMVKKRILINLKNPRISLKDLQLTAGTYRIFIEMEDAGDIVRSNSVSWVVDGSDLDAESGYLPAEIEIGKDGTIRIVIRQTDLIGKGKVYLVVANEDGKIVKRIPISSKGPNLSTKGWKLAGGDYTIYIEWVYSGQILRSKPIIWTIPVSTPEWFPIIGGDKFPGGIKLNPNGSITITLEMKESYAAYRFYLVVFDLYGNEVKRILIDPYNPRLLRTDLDLTTGGYTVVIEVLDPVSGLSAHSLPAFIPVNRTKDIVIFIDGELQQYKRAPVEINGRTLVPLRAIFEALGAKVEWDEATQTVTATKDGNVIQLTIGSKIAYKNGKKMMLDVPAQLFNGDTTMVPIRFVSEALGAKVGWDPVSRAVMISNE